MKQKSWLTPILVFIVCISFLLSYQTRQSGTSLARTVEPPSVPWNIDISHISKIEFKESSKNITAFISENEWQLLSPLQTSADSAYIYNILSKFSTPQLVAEVTSDVTNLAEYGIDKFSKSITLYDTTYNNYELICGTEASSSTYYVYSPTSGIIYTMRKEYFDSVSVTLSSWRDKDYLKFNPETTSKIKVYYNHQTYVLEPSYIEDEFSFASTLLPQNIVDTIINFLSTTRINTFIVDEASPSVIS
ncbi:MAG: DUF4340 domain-containing protein, partial [Cellulosilyticaceae bacterium]